jgi:hypothetical protein
MINLNVKKLYFGSSRNDIQNISSGKFLTSYKSIACCFAIDLEEVYGDLNKKYTSIDWSYDQWNKSEKYLEQQLIPEKIKITNNAKEWIKTSGTSIGYLYSIEVDEYLLNHLETFNDSDPKWEVVYNGHKKLPVKLVKKLKLNWECEYSKDKSDRCGFASIGAEKYEKPYDIKTLKELYPKLLEDPVHKWRAKNGIELIHKEPDFQEQKRIFYNWLAMSKSLQEKSDKKSMQLFKCSNMENHNWIMENEWHDENYFELADCRQRYDKRDMEENGLKYIHISLSESPITFIPRIPENAMIFPKYWKQYNEDKTIPRICCSNSIFGALAAIKVKDNKTYYVHLLEPKKVINNREVAQYVPDAMATGECWILDNEIKSTVIGKIEVGSLLPYTYVFLKEHDNFCRANFYDYTFIPFESKFNITMRKIKNEFK